MPTDTSWLNSIVKFLFFFYKLRSTLVGFCLFLIYLRQILIKLQKFVTIIADEQLSFFQMPMIIHTYIYYIHVHGRENISIIKFFQLITWVTDINQRFNQALCTLYISLLYKPNRNRKCNIKMNNLFGFSL